MVDQVGLVEYKVTDLYVGCMYPLREDAKAASDCCRKPATTAVERPDGMNSWRCPGHKGLVKGDETGSVHETVMLKPRT